MLTPSWFDVRLELWTWRKNRKFHHYWHAVFHQVHPCGKFTPTLVGMSCWMPVNSLPWEFGIVARHNNSRLVIFHQVDYAIRSTACVMGHMLRKRWSLSTFAHRHREAKCNKAFFLLFTHTRAHTHTEIEVYLVLSFSCLSCIGPRSCFWRRRLRKTKQHKVTVSCEYRHSLVALGSFPPSRKDESRSSLLWRWCTY